MSGDNGSSQGSQGSTQARVAAAATVRLDRLTPGHCAVVQDIAADDDDTNRLKTLGVCLGRKIELIQAGDPLILRVLGSRIGVSARLAQRVIVEPCTASACQPR